MKTERYLFERGGPEECFEARPQRRPTTYSLRVRRRRDGLAATVLRLRLDDEGRERPARLISISPVALLEGGMLIREAIRSVEPWPALEPGTYPVDDDYGARLACYAAVVRGLRNREGMRNAASAILLLDGTEAAWWLAIMRDGRGRRGVRALRILVGATA